MSLKKTTGPDAAVSLSFTNSTPDPTGEYGETRDVMQAYIIYGEVDWCACRSFFLFCSLSTTDHLSLPFPGKSQAERQILIAEHRAVLNGEKRSILSSTDDSDSDFQAATVRRISPLRAPAPSPALLSAPTRPATGKDASYAMARKTPPKPGVGQNKLTKKQQIAADARLVKMMASADA